MGEYRTIDSNEKTKEIQQKIMRDFGVDYDILYQVWLMFCSYIADGMKEMEAINEIKNKNIVEWNKALDFYISYGLNIISFKMDKDEKI